MSEKTRMRRSNPTAFLMRLKLLEAWSNSLCITSGIASPASSASYQEFLRSEAPTRTLR